MLKRTLALVVVLATGLTMSMSAHAEESFVPLFNGQNLDGWVQHGGTAEYTVEGDEIVGTSVPDTGNSFLCTRRHYADFILEVDFKVDPLLNSGIQIRSHVNDVPKDFLVRQGDEEKKITVGPGRVHGYQVEIDPSDRAWSGGIYDEGRRGWLNNLAGDQHAAARAAFKQNEWNHFRVEARGNSIKTWINGTPAADLTDDMTPSGFIALQVHGIGNDQNKVGKQIRWKNIRIQDLAPLDPWVHYAGKEGPGRGKHIVFIAGDEEYRSEEALPQLARILSERHGFDCTVLFPIDPQTGLINPNVSNNIPGTEALKTADLMVIFTRFRNLPDEQMQPINDYLLSGKPVIGLRTATHAFNAPGNSPWGHYGNGYRGDKQEWADGFGRLVLGEMWISHHGSHKHESTVGLIAPGAEGHPILRGIQSGDIWGPTDVYGVRLPLPGDSQPLVLGQVTRRDGEFDGKDPFFGMKPSDRTAVEGGKNDPMMPIVWIKSYQLPDGQRGQAVTSTVGSSTDMANEGVRRVLVNAAYYLTGLADAIPESGANADLVGKYEPTAYEFRKPEYWNERRMLVDEFRIE